MGNTTKQAVAVEGELRRIAVSRIRVVDGFNPRRERDPKRFAELVETVRRDGVLEPVMVTPNDEGDYDLMAGEGRFLAAVEAGCTEVPTTIRTVDPAARLRAADPTHAPRGSDARGGGLQARRAAHRAGSEAATPYADPAASASPMLKRALSQYSDARMRRIPPSPCTI